MTKKVPPSEIEKIVRVKRSRGTHFARAVSADKQVYILHSKNCLATHPDLRDCPYSLALDNGIDTVIWPEDQTFVASVSEDEKLIPLLPMNERNPDVIRSNSTE